MTPETKTKKTITRKAAPKPKAAKKPVADKGSSRADASLPPKQKRKIVPSAKKEAPEPKARFIYAVGRRKEATATVRLYQGASSVSINQKPVESYFTVRELQITVLDPIKVAGLAGKVGASIMVKGGGIRGQAEAARLGISRALTKLDANLRPSLKSRGFLKRDPRVKERRKYGLKKARKAPQWAKR